MPQEGFEAIDALSRRLQTATLELDDAKTRAAGGLDPLSFKLGRTRRRGVYRSGHLYVVPFVDEVNTDRLRTFHTFAEARNFHHAIQIVSAAKTEYTGPSYRGADASGSGGAY